MQRFIKNEWRIGNRGSVHIDVDGGTLCWEKSWCGWDTHHQLGEGWGHTLKNVCRVTTQGIPGIQEKVCLTISQCEHPLLPKWYSTRRISFRRGQTDWQIDLSWHVQQIVFGFKSCAFYISAIYHSCLTCSGENETMVTRIHSQVTRWTHNECMSESPPCPRDSAEHES